MFYQSISQVYDHIFPQNSKQLSFIETIMPIKATDKILDIGCATGNLTNLLSSKSHHVIGLDLDMDLLDVAKEKYPDYKLVHGNMLDITELFGEESFNGIISFGNTLVHLPSRDFVQKYFNEVYKCLLPNGYFMTQIINYDRIMLKSIGGLATIDNEHINFERKYDLKEGYVDFKTKLLIKSNQQIIENTIPLLALKQDELLKMLEIAGFEEIRFYGNLNAKLIEASDISLLFSCQKKG